MAAVILCCTAVLAQDQQTPSKATLDARPGLFGVVAAMNACGYDEDLQGSSEIRTKVRAEIARAVQKSERAQIAVRDMCAFMRDHQQATPSRDLAQYVSLAIHLGEPPAFVPRVKESELPPDAAYVLGVVPLLQRFYTSTDLSSVWSRMQPQYDAMLERFHDPVAKMLLTTDIYLKNQISGYVGRRFIVYVEPMAAPGQVNARVYGDDYFVVVSPQQQGNLDIDKIRHTYLHFVLDPLAWKRPQRMAELEALLSAVKFAPLDESYKTDISLLVTESLVRAIEARLLEPGKGKEAEERRKAAAERATTQGFVLAPHFNSMLVQFEKESISLQDAYADWLYTIDPGRERKRLENIVFASASAPDVAHTAKRKTNPLDDAERRLASGDVAFAKQIAEQVIADKDGDVGRAMFILAQAASMNRDMAGAIEYFEQALENSKAPRVLAWSHVYLGRIRDIRGERESAVEHYRAALEASKQFPTVPGAQSAAERGIQAPYQLPADRPKGEPESQSQKP